MAGAWFVVDNHYLPVKSIVSTRTQTDHFAHCPGQIMTHSMPMPTPTKVTTDTINESKDYTTEEILSMLEMCDPEEKEKELVDEIEYICARAEAEARALSPTRQFELDHCMLIPRPSNDDQQMNTKDTINSIHDTPTGTTITTPTPNASENAPITVMAIETTEEDLEQSVLTVVVNDDGTQTVHESMNIDKLPIPTIGKDGNVTFTYKNANKSKPLSPIRKRSNSPKSTKSSKSPTANASPKIVIGVNKPIASLASTQGVVTQRGHVYTPKQIEWFVNTLNDMMGKPFHVPLTFEYEYNAIFDPEKKNAYSYRSIRSKLQRMAVFN